MKNNLKTVVLLGSLAGLMVGLGYLWQGRGGAMIGLILAAFMNFGAYWFSDKVALRMSRARPLSRGEAPELYAMVAALADRANIPMPLLYLVPSEQPNAFATGRDPAHAVVAVTEGILKILSPQELQGVIAHELGHVRNRDILITSVAATIAAAISFVAQIARWGAFFGGAGRDDDDGPGGVIGLLVGMIVAPIAALILQMAISRSREFQADATGAQVAGNPQGLASALRKLERGAQQIPMPVNPSAAPLFIVNPLRGRFARGAASLFSTHPPIEERVRRLEAMPTSLTYPEL
jgi:heat shock protein HtpX